MSKLLFENEHYTIRQIPLNYEIQIKDKIKPVKTGIKTDANGMIKLRSNPFYYNIKNWELEDIKKFAEQEIVDLHQKLIFTTNLPPN